MTSLSDSSGASRRAQSIAGHLKASGTIKPETSYKFEGWLGLDKGAAAGKMEWREYQPKTWTEDDVDIKVSHCGICGSDLHTLRSGWGPSIYPCCVGHEIIGEAVMVGKNVKNIKVGDRVGVGAQCGSCLKHDCPECSKGLENYCTRVVGTYNSKYPDGSKSYGGYANYVRAPSHFVVQIPKELDSAEAAPMLCAGITVWSPLKNAGAGPGKSVGIVGIGGLGHFGLLWAKALGCDKVIAISRRSSKKEDALRMGADEFIAIEEDPNWAKNNRRKLDIIICTISNSAMPLSKYLQLLRTNGRFIQVGAPEEAIPGFSVGALIAKAVKIEGSSIGSPREIRQMLEFAAKNNIHPIIEKRGMKDANQAILDMDEGRARYRYVLCN